MFKSLLGKEVLNDKAKVTLVLGPLGSGKTSLVKRLLPHYPKDTILIINDVGAINIDSKRIKGNEVVSLQEGCVCCEDIKSLRDALIKLDGKTKNIIIEPSGISEGTSIKKVLTDLGYDVSTIFLGDIEHHKLRDEVEKKIIENQIKVADIVGLTWNNGNGDNTLSFKNWLEQIKPGIEIVDIPLVSDNQEYDQILEDKFILIREKINQAGLKYKEAVFKVLELGDEQNGKYLLFGRTNAYNSNNAPVFTLSKEINISLKQLKNILENNKSIIRAKGIVGDREFDYVHGSLSLGRYNPQNPYITFISTKEINFDLIQDTSKPNREYLEAKKIIDFDLSYEKIGVLVKQYHEYMDLEKEIQSLREELKNSNNINNISKQITSLQLKQKTLGESMKYDNPFIWIEYKRLAYAGTNSKVETIGELRKHCASPTYICHKRLMFLNSILKSKYNIDIFDSTIDENMTILDFLQNGAIQEISNNEDLMKQWLTYEYFEVDDRVSKWENFLNIN